MTTNTAAVTALETAAKALNDAVAALKAAPAETVVTRVGESFHLNNVYARADLDGLPVGSTVSDRDNDTWEKGSNGEWGVYGGDAETSASGVLNYTPITVTYVPVDAPAAADDVKVGDTVRIVEGYMGGASASIVGLTGILRTIEPGQPGGRTRYTIEPGFDARKVEKVKDEVAPVSDGRAQFSNAHDRTDVRVEKSIMTYSGSAAFLKVGYNSVHLTKDEARKLADALLVHANS